LFKAKPVLDRFFNAQPIFKPTQTSFLNLFSFWVFGL